MADKLSWTELRRALASRAGVSEKTAGAFLAAYQEQLLEALKADKQVKINGLGTFKVQAVAPRKSVNVATGEDIVIDGYNKLNFTPEAGVRELIESTQMPESEGEAAGIDPLQKLGAQAEEIVDILGDLGQSPVEAEQPAEEPEPVVEEPVAEPEPEPAAEPEKPIEEPYKYEEKMEEKPFIPNVEPEPEIIISAPKKKKKESHFLRDTLICVIILLLLLLVGYFFLRQQLSDIIDSFMRPDQTEIVADTTAIDEPAAEPIEEIPAVSSSQAEMIPEGAISQKQILAEFLEASGDYDSNRYPELITTEPMHEASRLAWMSKRYYGAKIYWPYLYDANRDILVNPCLIQVGTPIRVPKLSALQLDTTNAETAAYLEQLRLEAEEACGR